MWWKRTCLFEEGENGWMNILQNSSTWGRIGFVFFSKVFLFISMWQIRHVWPVHFWRTPVRDIWRQSCWASLEHLIYLKRKACLQTRKLPFPRITLARFNRNSELTNHHVYFLPSANFLPLTLSGFALACGHCDKPGRHISEVETKVQIASAGENVQRFGHVLLHQGWRDPCLRSQKQVGLCVCSREAWYTRTWVSMQKDPHLTLKVYMETTKNESDPFFKVIATKLSKSYSLEYFYSAFSIFS